MTSTIPVTDAALVSCSVLRSRAIVGCICGVMLINFGSARIFAQTGTKKPAIKKASDTVTPRSTWQGTLTDKTAKTSEVEQQITERRGAEFIGKFFAGGNLVREVKGTILNGRISWKGIKGGGELNQGQVVGNRMETTCGPNGQGSGKMSLATGDGDVTEPNMTSSRGQSRNPEYDQLIATADFEKRGIKFMKVFGQKSWIDYMPGQVDGSRGYHIGGVVVDRSTKPNPVYVVDAGNSRILGFKSFDSKKADLIFGQPDEFSGAPNGNSNVGLYGKPARDRLCLFYVPGGSNIEEQFLSFQIDVDSDGNLYVPDFFNNRVLVYHAPFSSTKTDGKGDALPDLVIGQPDHTSNGPNLGQGNKQRNASSLYLNVHSSTTGVSVDRHGNVWVADGGNHRVLRFPKGKTAADLVLGQPDFTTAQRNTPESGYGDGRQGTQHMRFCSMPMLARVDPDSGEVYVLDRNMGASKDDARILIFKPPFKNGMNADRILQINQPLEGDFKNGFRFARPGGFVFNSFKTDDWCDERTKIARYRDGVLWVHAHDANPNNEHGKRTLLLDKQGNILVALPCPNITTMAGRRSAAAGMMGFDAENHIYLATHNQVVRYVLPARVAKPDDPRSGPPIKDRVLGAASPLLDHRTNANNIAPGRFHPGPHGVIVAGKQLIVSDIRRFMVWDDYLNKPDGTDADHVVGQPNGRTISEVTNFGDSTQLVVDGKQRLWSAGEHGRLVVFQLPLLTGAKPLRKNIPLYWADDPSKEVEHFIDEALDIDPKNGHLWVFDRPRSRLLRIKNPDDWQGKLLVDAVLGQIDKTGGKQNRGLPKPDASTLGQPNAIRFDRQGNLFVVDNNNEGTRNGRIIAFAAADIAAIRTMFPGTKARWVYCVEGFDKIPPETHRVHSGIDHPWMPMSIAFNSKGEMVVGNGGYWNDGHAALRPIRQLYLYRNPLKKSTPDAIIELPVGAPQDLWFDDQDNLVVHDANYNRVGIINYVKDPQWLKPLK